MKELLNKKWHLHLLTLPLGILFIHYGEKGFLHLDDVGGFALGFFTVLFSFFAGFLVEWAEGFFFGANNTKEEIKQAKLDILACVVGGALAVVFGGNLSVALYSFVAIIVIEILRRYVNKTQIL